ncbi:S24/S26 family peptidase [Ethanoligenens harbinense]|uniref:S24/S26 family peptidase n=1 Tax=Ethanoligenens harbinense TaxID=253239 RepID=UPI0010BF7425|nr:S24/S26 family peptidase [Ethanoligenens harbinense]QCN91797.1 hypothetical protein DRA42_04485 [Ethanoligenens harbinense]
MDKKTVYTSLDNLSPIFLTMLSKKVDILLGITGTSMLPMLKPGRDQVELTNCRQWKFGIGDIPLYRRTNGQYVLHRIVRMDRSGYDLCGDHQIRVEKEVPRWNMLAVVKRFRRKGKWHSCGESGYQVYWHLWIFLSSFRRLVYRACRR